METIADLKVLLKKMQPCIQDGKYYMAPIGESRLMSLASYLRYITGIFREKEGMSVVFSGEMLPAMEAVSSGKPAGPFALITLQVDSSLFAVGFLAAVTTALAKEKISVNAFSACHHDHLLVPFDKRHAALVTLRRLGKG